MTAHYGDTIRADVTGPLAVNVRFVWSNLVLLIEWRFMTIFFFYFWNQKKNLKLWNQMKVQR